MAFGDASTARFGSVRGQRRTRVVSAVGASAAQAAQQAANQLPADLSTQPAGQAAHRTFDHGVGDAVATTATTRASAAAATGATTATTATTTNN